MTWIELDTPQQDNQKFANTTRTFKTMKFLQKSLFVSTKKMNQVSSNGCEIGVGWASLTKAIKYLKSLGLICLFFEVDKCFDSNSQETPSWKVQMEAGNEKNQKIVYIDPGWMLDVLNRLAVTDWKPWHDFFDKVRASEAIVSLYFF